MGTGWGGRGILHRQVVKVQQILHSEPSLDALSLRPNVTCSIKIIFRGRAGAYTHRPAGIEESRGCLGRSLEEDEVRLPPAHRKAQGPRLGFAAQGRVRAPGFSARSFGLGVVCVGGCVCVCVCACGLRGGGQLRPTRRSGTPRPFGIKGGMKTGFEARTAGSSITSSG